MVRGLSIYHVAAVAIFAATFLLAVLPRFDTDLWWHIYVGRHILNSGSVPTADFLSYTFRGHPWIDHEWLTEVVMYGLVKAGGYGLLFTVFGFVVTGAFVAAYVVMRRRGVGAILALVLTMLAAGSSVGSMGARVQMVTLVFAPLFCLTLENFRQSGQRRWLVMLVAGMLVWSNLHGGFVVGLMIIGCYLAGNFLDGLRSGWTVTAAARSSRALAIAGGAALVTTLANPNTYNQLLYPLKFVLPNAFTNAIQESQAPNFHLYQLLPFEFLLLALIVAGFMARRRVSWIDVLVTVLFTHLALQQTRNVALWAVVVVPVLGVYLQDVIQPVIEKIQHLNKQVSSPAIVIANLALVVALLFGAFVLAQRYVNRTTIAQATSRGYPVGAVDYLHTHPMQGHVFNSYNYGGFLIWTLNDRYPTFIDSRADTLYSSALLQDYMTVYDGTQGWQNILSRYNIRWLLVEERAPITKILSGQNGWKFVFKGRLAAILVRR